MSITQPQYILMGERAALRGILSLQYTVLNEFGSMLMLMSDNDPSELSEALRRWLDEGHLDASNPMIETLNIGQIKRRAAQRVLTAQRSRHDA